MENKGSHLAKLHVAIVPHRGKAQHFAIERQETLQTIEIALCLCRAVWRLTRLGVGVDGQLLLWVEFDALGGEETGRVLVTPGDVVDAAVDEHVDATVQISPVITVAKIILWQALTLEQFTLWGARVLDHGFNEGDGVILKRIVKSNTRCFHKSHLKIVKDLDKPVTVVGTVLLDASGQCLLEVTSELEHLFVIGQVRRDKGRQWRRRRVLHGQRRHLLLDALDVFW